MTTFLTVDDICRINQRLGKGAAQGADVAGIEAAANRPQASYAGEYLFPTLWLQAAALLHGLCSTQYFLDGNKRTAWVADSVCLTY